MRTIIEIPPPPEKDASPPEPLPPVDESKIIDIRGEPLEITEGDRKEIYCRSHHKQIYLDEHSRSVSCRECGKEIDPFDYLMYWAREGGRRMERLKALDDELRIKFNEVEAMKAVLAREKSKVRKINPDAPEVITWQRYMKTHHNP